MTSRTTTTTTAREALDEVLAEPPSGEPVQYVADQLRADLAVNDEAPTTDLDDASDLLIQLIERRLTAVHAANDGLPLGLLLSGGIDSILVAACAARLGLQVSSGTVAALMYCARLELAGRTMNRTYADPMAEPDEHTAVRCYLDLASADVVGRGMGSPHEPTTGHPSTTGACWSATPEPQRIRSSARGRHVTSSPHLVVP